MTAIRTLILCSIVFDLAGIAFGQAGRLDPSFRPRFNNTIGPVCVQADKKIVASGYFTEVNGAVRQRIVRLLPNGAIDPLFMASANDVVFSVALTSTGDLYLRGYFTNINGVSRRGLARIKSDGTLDHGFTPAFYEGWSDIAVQADDRLLVATHSEVFRLNMDGSVDESFRISVGSPPNAIQCIVSDGNTILVGGYYNTINGLSQCRGVAKLDRDGRVMGQFQTYLENLGPGVVSLLLMPDGAVIVGGTAFARLRPDGRTDDSFLYWRSNLQKFFTLGSDQKGRILVGGNFDKPGGYPANYLVRVTTNGVVDGSFKHSGPDDQVWGITVQPDDRILVTGGFQTYDGVEQPFIARLLGDQPVLDQRRIAPDQVELSWPAAYTNFVLQSAFGLPSTNWSNVPGTPLVVSNVCYVTNTAAAGNQFFRLVKQEP